MKKISLIISQKIKRKKNECTNIDYDVVIPVV